MTWAQTLAFAMTDQKLTASAMTQISIFILLCKYLYLTHLPFGKEYCHYSLS
jgi:hypothetical protein